MEAIKTENLTKYYGKSRGVLELNLSVEQGEVFGFIGPNGRENLPPFVPCWDWYPPQKAVLRFSVWTR